MFSFDVGETYSTLTIKPANGKFSGKYRVVAENTVGTDQAELEASVIGEYLCEKVQNHVIRVL